MKLLCDRCKREYDSGIEPTKWQEAICPDCDTDQDIDDVLSSDREEYEQTT